MSKIFGGAHEDHIVRFTHRELLDLLSLTRFELEKEHWQQPPYSFWIYLAAKKRRTTVTGSSGVAALR